MKLDTSKLSIPRHMSDTLMQGDEAAYHPGLLLDKYTPVDSKANPLDWVVQAAVDVTLFKAAADRRASMLQDLEATVVTAETAGPFTLHLARASVHENTGICLHPIHGFCYIPGSGLKGLARAFAETVWKVVQPNPEEAEQAILRVFGNERSEPVSERQHAGAVVFHEAWPEQPPALLVDVVNCHHAKYYAGQDEPGDWEDPNPSSFLAVPAGVRFCFPLSKRTPDDADAVALAAQWLAGGLANLGAGAKTAAGYGRFTISGMETPAYAPPTALTFAWDLTLSSPAFLAGKQQEESDCTLRVPTVRGILRSWWRTLHAAHLDTTLLRRLETAIWGSTDVASPVTITIEAASAVQAKRATGVRQGVRLIQSFACEHELDARVSKGRGRERAADEGAGLSYISYGMADGKSDRCYLSAGATWRVHFVVRSSSFVSSSRPRAIEALDVRRQVEAALWLLCQYGGIGSKGRKGFGSLASNLTLTLEDCQEAARELREALGIAGGAPTGDSTACLEEAIMLEVPTPWCDDWFALAQIGAAYRNAASAIEKKNRCALGLPRRGAPAGIRHASPIHLHLCRCENGTIVVRATAFPSPRLPDKPRSRDVLADFLAWFKRELDGRLAASGSRGRRFKPLDVGNQLQVSPEPALHSEIDAVLTRRGGKKKDTWYAKDTVTHVERPICNSAEMPGGLAEGANVKLVVSSKENYRWPSPKDLAKKAAQRGQGKQHPKGGQSRAGGRR